MILYQFAQDVAERDVTFLNPRRDRRRDDERVFDQRGQLSAVGASPGNRSQAPFMGRCDPFKTFGEFPLVLMPIAMSPVRPWARTWRAQSSSYP